MFGSVQGSLPLYFGIQFASWTDICVELIQSHLVYQKGQMVFTMHPVQVDFVCMRKGELREVDVRELYMLLSVNLE